MKLLNTALIKIISGFVTGILLGFYISLPLNLLVLISAIAFLSFIIAYFRAKKLFLQDTFFGINCFIIFLFLGMLTTKIHLPENRASHYVNYFPPEETIISDKLIVAEIREHLKPNSYSERYIVALETIGNKKIHGKILILIPDSAPAFEIDEKIAFSSEIFPIQKPLNPFQFDYKKFMANRGIFYQVRLQENEYIKLNSTDNSLQGMAANWRNNIVSALEENNFKQEELAIIQALLLGQRQDISEEIYENYAAAGVLHILAVSGLHVGIILLILNTVLSFLDKSKYGKISKSIILIILLWIFAVVAGLSPSVVRAVTMFSFLAVALQLKRRTSTLNILFISMLVLLIIKPQFIFEVGFQLSYLAVLSIVLIQPPLYKLYVPKNKILKYLWGIFTVTLAAQVGVMPLSLFYFHQFPGLFFLSNLVILPFLGIILGLGIFVMLLAVLDILPDIIAEIYSFLISSLNNFVDWVASQEAFLFQGITFSALVTVTFYLLLIALIKLLRNSNYRNIVFGLFSIIVLQSVLFYEKYHTSNSEFLIFHKSRFSIIGEKTDSHVTISHNLTAEVKNDYSIKNYITEAEISETESQKIKNIYAFRNEILLVIDSSGIYQNYDERREYVLLRESPKINLERLIKELQPALIIADGSNYKSFINRWRETSRKEKIPFHATGEKGAFIIKN